MLSSSEVAAEGRMPLRHRLWTWYVRQPNHPAKVRIQRILAKAFGIRRVRVVVDGHFVMDLPAVDVVSGNLVQHGQFEPRTLECIVRAMKGAEVFVDVGAHHGFFTLAVAATVDGACRIVAVEPFPENYCELARNVTLNRANNVIPVLAAGSAENSILALNNPGGYDNSTIVHVETSAKGGCINVPSLRIADVLRMSVVPRADVVKIDVEGHETAVLEGLFAEGTPKPKHIIFEYIPSLFPGAREAAKRLEREGYQLRQVDGSPFDDDSAPIENNVWASLPV